MRTLARSDAADIDLLLGFASDEEMPEVQDKSAQNDYSVACYSTLDDAETVWRSFEKEASGSVYQRFDWCKIALETLYDGENVAPLIGVVSLEERPVLLLPLIATTNRLGLKTADFIGESHANVRMPLVTTDPINRTRLLQDSRSQLPIQMISKAMAEQANLDHLSLTNMPKTLNGDVNVLVAPDAEPTIIPLFSGVLQSDFEELRNARRSTKAQRNARRNLRRIEDHGETTFQRVEDAATLDDVLDTFFEQKRTRLGEEGDYSSFDVSKNRTFIRALAHSSLEQNSHIFDVFTLTVNGNPVAIAAGGIHAKRFSMGVNSMTNEQAIASQGPGRLSVDMSVERFCKEGLGLFDLGLGEYSYKTMWCDHVETFDMHVSLSAKGRVFSTWLGVRDRLENLIRSSDALLKIAKGVRHKLRGGN